VSVEHAALFEVLDERGDGLIGHAGVVAEFVVEIAVMIPARVHDADKAHAALHEATCEQAVGGEGLVLSRDRRRERP
jgi:hypothetical protein